MLLLDTFCRQRLPFQHFTRLAQPRAARYALEADDDAHLVGLATLDDAVTALYRRHDAWILVDHLRGEHDPDTFFSLGAHSEDGYYDTLAMLMNTQPSIDELWGEP
jgi:hypothetical protein